MKAANYQPSLSNWQIELAQAVTNPKELLTTLDLESHFQSEAWFKAHHDFSLRVPRGFIARMEKGNPKDPLLLQVLPQAIEMEKFPGFSCDPLQEKPAVPGMLHKYKDRVLFIMTGACAVHCRYCFRRHFPYENHREGWDDALNYLRAHPEIKEVIFSGGDPLVVKDQALSKLIQAVEEIPHIKRLRFHTRLPIVLPERITEEFVTLITSTRLKPVMILHCNHANEIHEPVKQAVARLLQCQIPVFNQAVLLKTVNDSEEALINLSEALFEAGIMPYYLHLLDPVQGAAHFAVKEERAKALIAGMLRELPGYLVPKLVREVPGMQHKMPI